MKVCIIGKISVQILLSVKNLIPEIWTEMPLAYQTVRFLNSEVAWFDNDKIFFASIEIHENSKLI